MNMGTAPNNTDLGLFVTPIDVLISRCRVNEACGGQSLFSVRSIVFYEQLHLVRNYKPKEGRNFAVTTEKEAKK
jgi:hypothetical protein